MNYVVSNVKRLENPGGFKSLRSLHLICRHLHKFPGFCVSFASTGGLPFD
jgi:hypothetical protein